MGDLTLANYQTRVLLALGNLDTDHPVISGGLHTTAINDAANDLIRMYPERFPEHNDNTWTLGPTTVGLNTIALPSNLLVIEKVNRSDDAVPAGSPPSDWTSIKELLVSQLNTHTIGMSKKDSDVDGYPMSWDRKATNLLYWPTTRTGYTTYFRIYGLAGEERISAAGATFRMHRDYDEAIILFAASKVATLIGRPKRSAELEAAARRKVEGGLGVVNEEMGERRIEGFSFGSTGGW